MTPVAQRVVRVAVVNDFDVVIAGVQGLLAPYVDRVDVVDVSTRLPPADHVDVVLLDTFGRADIRTRLAQVLRVSAAKVLVYSWGPSSDHVAGYVSLGASGYVSKRSSGAELVAAIEAVARGGNLLRVALDSAGHELGAWPGQSFLLTSRESEVVALIVAGMTNAEIGERLYLGVNTIKTYIRTAYRKMGVDGRSQAVIWGVDHGFHVPPMEPPEL